MLNCVLMLSRAHTAHVHNRFGRIASCNLVPERVGRSVTAKLIVKFVKDKNNTHNIRKIYVRSYARYAILCHMCLQSVAHTGKRNVRTVVYALHIFLHFNFDNFHVSVDFLRMEDLSDPIHYSYLDSFTANRILYHWHTLKFRLIPSNVAMSIDAATRL